MLETDPTKAREIARLHLKTYLGLPNYSNNWKRQGFTDDDIADGGSDRLVDALVVWGDEATIAARVQEHRDAGADHVCIQVLDRGPAGVPGRPVAGPGTRARLRSIGVLRAGATRTKHSDARNTRMGANLYGRRP